MCQRNCPDPSPVARERRTAKTGECGCPQRGWGGSLENVDDTEEEVESMPGFADILYG